MTSELAHLARIEELRKQASDQLKGQVIAVASDKGGIGKTTLAVELAYIFGLPLADGDWHEGNASASLGFRHRDRQSEFTPFLAAVRSGKTPRPIRGGRAKPDLIASGPDLEHNQPAPDVTAKALVQWTRDLGTGLVVDTHPGGGLVANDACQEARVVLTTSPLREKDLGALDGWAEAMDGYPLMIVPNMVPFTPPASQFEWLREIAVRLQIPVTTFIPRSAVFEQRKARTALCSSTRPSAKVAELIEAFLAIAEEVLAYVNATKR